MALGKRQQEQQDVLVATTSLPQSPGHPFYQKLNRLLAEAKFDDYVEGLCRPYYAAKLGRPGVPPGVVAGRINQRKRGRRCTKIAAGFVGSGASSSVVFVVSIQNEASRMFVTLAARGGVAFVA